MITLASLNVVLDADTPAKAKIHDTGQAVEDFGGQVNKAHGPTTGFFSSVGGGALEFAKAVPGIAMMVGGVADLATGMIKGNAEFETYETQFGVLLGSADAAKARLAELAKFGATTPFELPELVQADKVLTSFGLDSAKTATTFGVSAEQIRTTIGDVASGTGVGFQELALTFGKFASGATGEAISRFQELGIATREEMAGWGLQFSKTGQLLTPAKEAFSVLEEHVRGKFGGMMNAQSQTFDGMVSNLQDWMGSTQRTLAAPLFEVLKEKLGALLTWLTSPEVMAGLTSFATFLGQGISFAIDVIMGLGNVLGPIVGMILPIVQGFLGLGAGVEAANSPLASVSGLLTQVSTIFSSISGVIGSVVAGFSEGGLAGAFGALTENIPNLLSGFQLIGLTIADQAVDWALQLVKWVGDAIPGLLVALGQFGATIFTWITSEGIPQAVTFLMEMAQKFIDFIVPAIPGITQKLTEFGTAILNWILNEGIPQAFNMLVDLGKKFVEWVAPNIPPLLEALGGMLASLTGWLLTTALPMIISKLLEWGKAFIDWIGPNIGPMLEQLGALLGSIGTWLLTVALPELGANLQQWGKAFVDWVGPQIPPLLQSLGTLLGELGKWIVDVAAPAAVTKLGELAQAFLGWVGKDVLPFIGSKLAEFGTAVFNFLNQAALDAVAKAGAIGSSIIDGIIQKLRDGADGVKNFVVGIAQGAVDAIKDFFGIHSPSKLMFDLFGFVVEGGRLGVKDKTPDLVRQFNTSMGQVVGSVKGFGPSLAASFVPNTRGAALASTVASTGFSPANGPGITLVLTNNIYGLQGDIQSPDTWKQVIRPILQAAQGYLGPNVNLVVRSV